MSMKHLYQNEDLAAGLFQVVSEKELNLSVKALIIFFNYLLKEKNDFDGVEPLYRLGMKIR